MSVSVAPSAAAGSTSSSKPAAAAATKVPASSPGKPQSYAFSPYQSQVTMASPVAAPSAVAQLMSATPTGTQNPPHAFSDYYSRFPNTRQALNLDMVNSRLLGLGVKTLDGTAMGPTSGTVVPPSPALTADRISQEFKSRLKHASSSASVQQQLQTPTLVNLLHTAQPSTPQPTNNSKAAKSVQATPLASPVATPNSPHMQQQPHTWPYHPNAAVYGSQPAMLYPTSQHPNTPPMLSPMYAYSMAMPAFPLPTTPGSPAVSALKPARHRRKAQDLADNERWQCDQGCGKIYRLTSTQSIKQHQRTCKFGQHGSSGAKRRKLQSDHANVGDDTLEDNRTSRNGTDIDTSTATTPQRLSKTPEKAANVPCASHQSTSLHPVARTLLLSTLALAEWPRMPGVSSGANLTQLISASIPRRTGEQHAVTPAIASSIGNSTSSTSASTATCTTSHAPSSSSAAYLFPSSDPASQVSAIAAPPPTSTWSSAHQPSTALAAIVQQQHEMLGRSTDAIDTDDDSPLSSDNDDN